jgi:hypothetical protein
MDRYSIPFLFVIILCCATDYFSRVTMELDEKINKLEARNVELEEKVNQLKNQLENQLENQRVLNVSLSFIFSSFLLIFVLLLETRIILAF